MTGDGNQQISLLSFHFTSPVTRHDFMNFLSQIQFARPALLILLGVPFLWFLVAYFAQRRGARYCKGWVHHW